MRRLIHMPHDPACRMVRVALAEKGLPAQLEEARPWEETEAITRANPAGELPVLLEEGESSAPFPVAPAAAVIDYLEDAYGPPLLLPEKAQPRAEARRLVGWFTDKFETEVITLIVRERIDKRMMRRGQPDYDLLRAGLEALDWHMDYFGWLLDQRTWFAGESYGAADIAAAAYLSAVDYVDAAPWDRFPIVKEWYARVKSRPAFRPVLRDRIEGLPPPRHYEDPDF